MAAAAADGRGAGAWVRDLLKERGLRYSRPRAAILGFFLAGDRHISAEALHRALHEAGVSLSLSTVYLNLSVLSGAALIRELKGIDGVALYDSNVIPHAHLRCTVTGEVIDVPELDIAGVPLGRYLKELVEAATGWQVAEPTLSFDGVSPHASKKRR